MIREQMSPRAPAAHVRDGHLGHAEPLGKRLLRFTTGSDLQRLRLGQLGGVHPLPTRAHGRAVSAPVGGVLDVITNLDVVGVHASVLPAEMSGEFARSDSRRRRPSELENRDVHPNMLTIQRDHAIAGSVCSVRGENTVLDAVAQAPVDGCTEPGQRFSNRSAAGVRIAVLELTPVVAMAQPGLMKRLFAAVQLARLFSASSLAGTMVVRLTHALGQVRLFACTYLASTHRGTPLGLLEGV